MSDWDTVTVLKKRPDRPQVLKTETDINAARRAGASITTAKKSTSNSNGPAYDAGKAAQLDNNPDDVKIEKIGLSVAKTIQQARAAKGMTQKDLATKINEKQTVVNEYEAGKGVPNQQVLGKMERVLGVKLRGQNIGAPLNGPGK